MMFTRDSIKSAGLWSGIAIALMVAGCGSQGANSALVAPGVKAGSPIISGRQAVAAATFATTHVLTADYFADQFPSVSTAQMAPYLDWAWSTASESADLRSAGIKTMLYTNPNRQAPGGPMYTNDESTFAHDCSGNRITFPAHHGIYLMDPTSTKLQALWQKTVSANPGQFDAIYDDTADNVSGATSLPCNFSQSAWTVAVNALNSTLGHPIMYNGLGNLNSSNGVVTTSSAIALNSTGIGGMMEGCYSNQDDTIARPNTKVWLVEENTEIQMAQQGKRFICRGLNLTPASSAFDNRTYMVASFLLTYDLGSSILSEKFPSPSNFNEDPESQLVATNPIVQTPGDISGLQVSPNVYAREYSACYIAGVSVGPCAAVVNSDKSGHAHPFPWPTKYQHTLALSGNGILDGGKATADGPAPAASIPGDSAVIAIATPLALPTPTPMPLAQAVTYHAGTASAPISLFYTLKGESGAIAQEIDLTATGPLTNETLTYKGLFGASFGWVTGAGQPGLTSWPAASYTATLNITQPNAALQITDVKIYRVDSNGGPNTSGLALIGELPNLTQALGAAGPISFTIPGQSQLAGGTDRLAVRFRVQNSSLASQSFSYDAGLGAASSLTVTP